MFKLDENYFLRKCFFQREQVPTQSAMRKKMGPLADVYFNYMTYKLKVLAGLEPRLSGGGNDWYVVPEELLKSRAVMQPVEKQILNKLGYKGIDFLEPVLLDNYNREKEQEKQKALNDSDENWKRNIVQACKDHWDAIAQEEADNNTNKFMNTLKEFEVIYRTSCDKLENMMMDAAKVEIENVKHDTHAKMMKHYKTLLKDQATMLYDKYEKKYQEEKAKAKQEFVNMLTELRTTACNQVHDVNVDKHMAIEKLRQLLECQNVACQVYVALKEREECTKQIEEATHYHKKKVRKLNEEIQLKDYEIKLLIEKEKKRNEFERIWAKKVCHIFKKFQQFVSYCLQNLPDYADFFLNLEKLMLLQLNEVSERPDQSSLFEEEAGVQTPVPKSKPFILVGDVGSKPHFKENLCPKKVFSPTQLPVIVINKQCIYSACDNMEAFADKMREFLRGKRGDDEDFVDTQDYSHAVPVTHNTSQQLLELKLEDSIMQIIQKELPNVNNVSLTCCTCKLPYCFCSPSQATKSSCPAPQSVFSSSASPVPSVYSGNKLDTRSAELMHEREPKWESFMDYVNPYCKCPGAAKKHLREHLPSYMRNTSKYAAPEIPNYEPCDVHTLRRLVKKALNKPPPPEVVEVKSATRDVDVQYQDEEFEAMCTCFSEDEINKFYRELAAAATEPVRGPAFTSKSTSPVREDPCIFAVARAFSLRNLMASPSMQEIFQRRDCDKSQL